MPNASGDTKAAAATNNRNSTIPAQDGATKKCWFRMLATVCAMISTGAAGSPSGVYVALLRVTGDAGELAYAATKKVMLMR